MLASSMRRRLTSADVVTVKRRKIFSSFNMLVSFSFRTFKNRKAKMQKKMMEEHYSSFKNRRNDELSQSVQHIDSCARLELRSS